MVRAKKKLGQHFLVQPKAIHLIVEATLASQASALLEIGPGPGVLTEHLLKDGRALWAIELDPEACEQLRMHFGGQPHFHLLEGDAVKVGLPPQSSWSVVGNLPYNAATAILTRFLIEAVPWDRMVLMFQQEVGQKLLGHPGHKNYGPLSVLAQLCARMTPLLKLGPQAFQPPPKVDSMVLLFEPRSSVPLMAEREPLLRLLQRSFAHRRKTLANNWAGMLSENSLTEVLAPLRLSPKLRAEAIAPEDWLHIFRTLIQSCVQ